jgi:hypothetical protein
LIASVAATTGSTLPTGAVQFSINGSAYGSPVTLAYGLATFTTTALPVGVSTISAVYIPTGLYSAGTFNTLSQVVQPANPNTPVISKWPLPGGITYGQTLASSTLTYSAASVPGTFAYTNPAIMPLAGAQTESVTFTPTNTAQYSSVVGSVIVPVNKQKPVYPLTASVTSATFGQSVTFTATLPADATGTVAFQRFNQLLGTATLVSGIATITTTITTSTFTVGANTISAGYSGDTNYNSAPSTLNFVINKATFPVTLTSSINPSNPGQGITFTATIPVNTTGAISFMDGATIIDTNGITNGTVSYSTTKLAAGTHTITAVFEGNSYYNVSTSNGITQTVN